MSNLFDEWWEYAVAALCIVVFMLCMIGLFTIVQNELEIRHFLDEHNCNLSYTTETGRQEYYGKGQHRMEVAYVYQCRDGQYTVLR